MVLESEPVLFYEWIGPALLFFFQAAAILGLIALVVGYLIAAFRYGPLEGGDVTFRKIKRGLGDLLSISPRRVSALAWLAVQESLRRRVLVGFAVFVLILLFAGWFLDTKSNDPATLYLSFVLTATTYLVLLMALLLSVFSLPTDIKNKTIHTVVTKPVRPGEIVLGRIIGFSLIGTLLLAIMGVFAYFFVVRVLVHSHEVEIASLESVPNSPSDQRAGRTTLVQNHRHKITIDADGKGSTDIVHGHWHEVDPRTDDEGKVSYALGPPQDLFTARVPVYGNLRFKDRSGKGVSRGINIGNEWQYRSFIEGATLATAIFTFDDVGYVGNQSDMISCDQSTLGNTFLMARSTLRAYGSRFKEGIRKVFDGSFAVATPETIVFERYIGVKDKKEDPVAAFPFFSLLTSARVNNTSNNQGDHCILVVPDSGQHDGRSIDHNNQVLYSRQCSALSEFLGREEGIAMEIEDIKMRGAYYLAGDERWTS